MSQKLKIKATVLLLTYNGEQYLEEVLESLLNQETSFPFEILIIDSGSTDKTLEIIKKHLIRTHCNASPQIKPSLHLHQIPNSSFQHGRTRNLGVKMAKGEYVALLTQDATPSSKNWLNYLVNAFRVTPKLAGVFGPHLPRANCTPIIKRDLEVTFRGFGEKLSLQKMKTGTIEELNKIRFYSDVNSCLKKEVWKKFPYPQVNFAEDQLWAENILKAGYFKAFEPKASVIHSHSYSLFKWYSRLFEEFKSLKLLMGVNLVKTWYRIPIRIIQFFSKDLIFLLKEKSLNIFQKLYWVCYSLIFQSIRWTAAYKAGKLKK